MSRVDWIAADWGTSNLRVWGMSADGVIVETAQSEKGMGRLSQDQFEPALKELIAGWIQGPTTVVACGMVGSRQGWTEASYETVPCTTAPSKFYSPNVLDPNLDVRIIPGIRQMDPADVMRGEETQIAGFLALNPDWDGVICLPGTHTKWVHISANEVVSFQTFMTGEIFSLLSKNSVLQHSIGKNLNTAGFDRGVEEAIARPERLAARLFSLRAESLLIDQDQATSTGRLSGLLIGAELAGAKPYWLGQQVTVLGAGPLSKLYVDALATQSVQATQVQGERATLAGLTAAYRQIKE